MQALLDAPESCNQVKLVISSSPLAHGVCRARRFGVQIEILPDWLKKKEFKNQAEEWLLKILEKYRIEKIFLAGFMKILSSAFILKFGENHIYNIHPSLLPLYKGVDGFDQTLKSDAKNAGVTIHKVTEAVDSGEFVVQRSFEIPLHRNKEKSQLLLSINEQRVLRESFRQIICAQSM
jgi:phosphoribosylglycinamide formyltransferase-1